MSINYTEEDHQVWHDLITQQLPIVSKIACKEYLEGLELLKLSIDRIPNISEVSAKLYSFTGWNLIIVDNLISNRIFLQMLANKQFPVIPIIRSREEIDFYTNESPDVFHELFGHCPLLTNKQYANSMWKIGNLSLNCDDKLIERLAHIFWATYEFGLLDTAEGIKIYGAGILPSKSETNRAVESNQVIRKKLNIFSDLDASLQGNIAQAIYYTIDSLEMLYDIVENDIEKLISKKLSTKIS